MKNFIRNKINLPLMKLIKRFTLLLIIFLIFSFLFSPELFPENLQFKEFFNSPFQSDILIIFNSGGWGNTPLENAEDFAPIIEGIQETLNKWGLNSVIVPYVRTKDNFLGKITAAKDMNRSFQNQSEKLARNIEEFLGQNPGKKIIMAGLSNGAVFADETMEKLSRETKELVFAVEAGIPFWEEEFHSENILHLNNNGKDSLSKGEIRVLISTLLKAPLKWFSAKISGSALTFSQAIQIPGHEYFWDSPEVGSQIVNFLESKIR